MIIRGWVVFAFSGLGGVWGAIAGSTEDTFPVVVATSAVFIAAIASVLISDDE